MKVIREDIPFQFHCLIERIGLENTVEVMDEFSGMSVYFPSKRNLYKRARDREILCEFNGFNYRELSVKHRLSESHVRDIIRESYKK